MKSPALNRFRRASPVCTFACLLLCSSAHLFAQERFRKTPPYPDPSQDLRLPLIESVRLSNGLRLALGTKENLPQMCLQLVIFAGEADSPAKTPGLATFAAQMIGRGTQFLSSSDIEEDVEAMGGNFSAVAGLDCTVFSLSFLESYLDQALDLLSKMILQPTFPDREVDTVKRTLFYDLLEKAKDPDFVAKRQLVRLLFGNHPYRLAAHNEDVIKNFGQKELIVFFEKFYRPGNALIVLAGNLNLTTASRKVSHYFNTWMDKPLERAYPPPPEANDQIRVCFLDLPQAKDATIYLGNIIFPIYSSDYFPFIVFNQVLGGTPNSRLFMNLRESKAFAYFAFSEAEFYKSCGLFFVRARVTPEATYASIQEILKEIQSVSREKISTSEIEQAKTSLIGNFPLKNERLDRFSSTIAEIQTFNLGEERWSRYYENVMLVNSESVFEVVQRYPLLSPIIVIVGNKDYVFDYLRDFQKVEIYDSKGVLKSTISKGVSE